MSTIKSSAEHLTLNADGASKDIKFQANGVEKASISSAGAFTSTTIDATKLTGTIPNFTSTGIDDNATSTAITISAEEHVGIGVVPESDWSGGYSVLQMGTTGAFTNDTNSTVMGENWKHASGNKYLTTGEASRYYQNAGKHYFQVAASGSADAAISFTEAMTLLNNGQLLIGATTTSGMSNGTSNYGLSLSGGGQITSATNNDTNAIFNMSNGSSEHHLLFRSNGSTTGYVSTNGSSVAYNTGSDYRLKENVDYTWDATTRLKQLKPARFNFIADDTTTVDGFLAHEAATVVPECVSGTKDAMMDEEYEVTPAVMDGDTVVTEAVMGTRSVPDMQGIDQSKLVPLLVKTIQELEARITALEA